MSAISKWCSNHRELFYALTSVLVLWVVWRHRYYLDPSIGFDGWSDLFYTLSRLTSGFLVVLAAYLADKATHGEVSDEQDADIRARIISGEVGACRLYVLQMVSTAFWVIFFGWLILR